MGALWQQFITSLVFEYNCPLMAEIAVILTLITAFAAWHYIKENKFWYYVLLIAYVLSSIIVILTDNWFFFLFGWEIVSLSTALLLAWSNWKLVKQYFVIQFLGGSILLFAALAANVLGYSTIGPIDSIPLQFLLIMGVAMKSGLLFFHFWLAPIHSEAPAPVSAILSGWVVKLGYIFLLKIIPVEGGNTLLYILGFLMVVYGGFQALRSADLKVMLAFSTVSQLGMIALAIGTGGQYAYGGAVMAIIAHAFAKTTLFIASGIWQKEYGTRIIYEYKKPFVRRPITSIATILAYTSLAGVVFSAAFNAKYLIKYSQAPGLLTSAVFFIMGLISVLYSARIIYWMFIKDEDYSNVIEELKAGLNHYPVFSTDTLALSAGVLGVIAFAIWPHDILIRSQVIEMNYLGGFRDTLVFILISAYLLYDHSGFKIDVRTNLHLENYLEVLLNFFFGLSRKDVKFDTDKIFETFFYNAIYNASKKLHDFVYQDLTMQLLWIPAFLSLILLWQYIYNYFL